MSTGTTAKPRGNYVTEPQTVGLPAVENALMALWKHHDLPEGTARGILTRACMSNLVIVCQGRDEAAKLTEEVDVVVSRHPSRVILLVIDKDDQSAGSPIRAEVTAHCHTSGDKRQVCSEMVAVTAGEHQTRLLPSAARSLLVGDLPTAIWWDGPEPPPLAGALFDELKLMARQVIFSSFRWSDPVRGTLAAADWVADAGPNDPRAVDLAWRGLRPWRQLISQSLDPAAVPGALDRLDGVEIEHGPHGLPQAWLLAGWVASSLGWTPEGRSVIKGQEMTWKFRAANHGQGTLVVRIKDGAEPPVSRVTMGWKGDDGKPARLTFEMGGPEHLGASAEGLDAETRVLKTPPLPRAVMVASELQHHEADPTYHAALSVARRLAENLKLK